MLQKGTARLGRAALSGDRSYNLSDRCDSWDLNFLYAWRMTIIVSWVRIYQKAFMCSENSGIVLRKVRILILSGEIRILTLRSAFPDLLVRKIGNRDKVRIHVSALVSSLLIILNHG